ncbi:hypothetical protein PQQ75_25075 [Paraburkholderia aspalathi]|uniref:hypothetical protein n=1 Tax=Paraburkholderia aspalathi TaxID=1324617 RepID=UPI0038BA5BC8
MTEELTIKILSEMATPGSGHIFSQREAARSAIEAIQCANTRIVELEAALTVPDDALPPDGQEWAKVLPTIAFHLIGRHAENWAHAGQLMEAWRAAVNSAADAPQPAGYCIRHADGLRWRTLDTQGAPDWTTDEAEALCFSLRHHADAFACDDPEDVRIVPRANGGRENGYA